MMKLKDDRYLAAGYFDRLYIFLGSLCHESMKTVMTQSQIDLWKSRYPDPSLPSLIELEKNASFGMYFAHYLVSML